MFVKPASGRQIRDPVRGKMLPDEGATVPDSLFWRRRLRDGDVVLATATTASTGSTATSTGSTAASSTDTGTSS